MDVSVVEGDVEIVIEKLDYKFGEEDLVADGTAPGLYYQAEFCHFAEGFPVCFLAHCAVGIDVLFEDNSGHTMHAQVGKESGCQQIYDKIDDANLADAVG